MRKVNESWEVSSCLVSHKFLLFLWIPKFHYSCSQEQDTVPSPEPDESRQNLQTLFIYLFKYDWILSFDLRLKFPVIKVLY